jgi:pullulanase/glycogen debranching enzyme
VKQRWVLFAGLWAGAALAQPAPTQADCDRAEWAQVLQANTAPSEAAAYWFNRRHIRWPGPGGSDSRYVLQAPGRRIVLQRAVSPAPPPGFAFVAAGVDLQLPAAALPQLPSLLQGELLLTEIGPEGEERRRTALQQPGLLDDLYAAAETSAPLGATLGPGRTTFRVWAPTARRVALCLHADGAGPAQQLLPLQRDARTGIWSRRLPRKLSGYYYTYLVDVFVPGAGLVRNRVTDPYSLSLNTDSRRSWIGDLNDPALQPEGWAATPRPDTVQAATDQVVYELHLRDFSASDANVPTAQRGRYAAFTESASAGMHHLRTLARAGVTDVHLLPVFDFATVSEQGCTTPEPDGAPDGEAQQALVMAGAAQDCFDWGYDPLHFGAPEGSYASDASRGEVRVLEFRRMVQALHRAGLRVGMDMVYNHTSASGQKARSVLDRIVPGYYQRLDAQGRVETSTCCANTATEHRMMARLMIDTAVVWARDYRIASMRFDLMGHQPRAAMERLQRAVDAAAGRHIHLLGEGWNFGEVKDGARFVQASQARLAGSGIASFSDRARDALRGGGCCDDAATTLARHGWLNGARGDELLRLADLVRVGLAGTLRDYRLLTHDGSVKPLSMIDYAGQGAGYASQPGEVVNYVENHDNATLFDLNVLKLPASTSREDRARVQVLGLAATAFSQGIAYFHAGVELLRSKSGDRNSFDSGDWFNRLDWTAQTNHWGSGLPPRADNEALWPALKPRLADPTITPGPAEIAFTRDAFLDLLRIRASSPLFRLRSAAEVQQRLRFLNTGPAQNPALLVGHLQGDGTNELLYALNRSATTQTVTMPELAGHPLQLHPVQRAPAAADPRPREQARWDATSGTLTVPPLTALVYGSD